MGTDNINRYLFLSKYILLLNSFIKLVEDWFKRIYAQCLKNLNILKLGIRILLLFVLSLLSTSISFEKLSNAHELFLYAFTPVLRLAFLRTSRRYFYHAVYLHNEGNEA